MEKRETLIEFLDRTFVDRVEKVSREEREDAINAIKKGDVKVDSYKILRGDLDRTTLNNEWIKENVDNILKLEEFRFTNNINIIDMPMYLAKDGDNTLTPCQEGEPSTKAISVVSYLMNNQMDTHYFPEVVNLYAIVASPKVYDNGQVQTILEEKGKVHILPPVVDNNFLVPKHEVRLSWNPEEVQDMLGTSPKEVYDKWKSDIIKEIEGAIDNYECNFPYTKNYMLRGTHLQRESLLKREN
jgi:hypothetical protein